MSQATRFNQLCALTGKSNPDSAYHAAFYLLSYDQELYDAVCKAVTHNGIDFAKIKRTTCGFDERTKFVVDIAHNLFSYNSPCKATPFEISRLGYPLMEQVCNALYIAADQVKVIVRQDENKRDVMILDNEPYQKTKDMITFMEQLGKSITAEAMAETKPPNLEEVPPSNQKAPTIAQRLADAKVQSAQAQNKDDFWKHELPKHAHKSDPER